MTPDQINAAIAEACGDDRYLLVKRGLFYRPNACGYTAELEAAGIYTLTEASRREGSKGQPDEVRKRKAPPRNYHGSLDAMATAEATLQGEEVWDYRKLLQSAVLRGQENGKAEKSTHFIYGATAAQRAEAFLSVKKSGGVS